MLTIAMLCAVQAPAQEAAVAEDAAVAEAPEGPGTIVDNLTIELDG